MVAPQHIPKSDNPVLSPKQMNLDRHELQDLLLGMRQKKTSKWKMFAPSSNRDVVDMQKRNEDQPNNLIGLGIGADHQYRGKALIPGTKALKHADYEDYWPVHKDALPPSTFQQEYPGYSEE